MSPSNPQTGPRPAPSDRDDARWGIWLIGARGSVATTATIGRAALAAGRTTTTGMVTEHGPISDLTLPSLADAVIGGTDISTVELAKRGRSLEASSVIPMGITDAVGDDLAAVDARIRPGISAEEAAHSPSAALARLRGDLAAFRSDNDLGQVVVVNVSSTEAPVADHPSHHDVDALMADIAADRDVVPPSALYALAAIGESCGFVDFTPSSALVIPAVLAAADGVVPVGGRDGKTGETLVKTALAPMFADRALKVHSWSGMNLLGGGDGETLADPVTAASKVASKGDVLDGILGYRPEGPVRIDHVADLGDWKTAWDLITFEGFLGTRMQMQFVWQGCDSSLAAPLVLDLCRLTTAAMTAGQTGVLPALGYFFKAPLGGASPRLAAQYADLLGWTRTVAGA